jgi:hypothetical protein
MNSKMVVLGVYLAYYGGMDSTYLYHKGGRAASVLLIASFAQLQCSLVSGVMTCVCLDVLVIAGGHKDY